MRARTPASAEEILAAARARADEVLAAAQAEAEALLEQARADGFEEGERAGRDAAAGERAMLSDLLCAVESGWQTLRESQVPVLAEVAALAAGRILREQLSVEPERVTAVVRHALQQLPTPGRPTVHLHPDDVPLVQGALQQRRTRKGEAPELVTDPGVERGGCWITSSQGEVDATLAGSTARLADAVREALADERGA